MLRKNVNAKTHNFAYCVLRRLIMVYTVCIKYSTAISVKYRNDKSNQTYLPLEMDRSEGLMLKSPFRIIGLKYGRRYSRQIAEQSSSICSLFLRVSFLYLIYKLHFFFQNY